MFRRNGVAGIRAVGGPFAGHSCRGTCEPSRRTSSRAPAVARSRAAATRARTACHGAPAVGCGRPVGRTSDERAAHDGDLVASANRSGQALDRSRRRFARDPTPRRMPQRSTNRQVRPTRKQLRIASKPRIAFKRRLEPTSSTSTDRANPEISPRPQSPHTHVGVGLLRVAHAQDGIPIGSVRLDLRPTPDITAQRTRENAIEIRTPAPRRACLSPFGRSPPPACPRRISEREPRSVPGRASPARRSPWSRSGHRGSTGARAGHCGVRPWWRRGSGGSRLSYT
jgi:hypothetical protein